jgi:hypothetical protein
MDRTLDRVMGEGVYTPKPTIPVLVFDAVVIRPVGGGCRGWLLQHRPKLEDARLVGV